MIDDTELRAALAEAVSLARSKIDDDDADGVKARFAVAVFEAFHLAALHEMDRKTEVGDIMVGLTSLFSDLAATVIGTHFHPVVHAPVIDHFLSDLRWMIPHSLDPGEDEGRIVRKIDMKEMGNA